MQLSAKERSIFEALEPYAEQQGIEIVTVQVVGARKSPTVRIYLDKPEGVGFDDIGAAQVWIDEVMDRMDPFPGAYVLEVSSPGLDRPLCKPEHFARYAGQTAYVKAEPVEGRGAWTGTIVSADEKEVVMNVDGQEYRIPFEGIKRAQLKGTVDFSKDR